METAKEVVLPLPSKHSSSGAPAADENDNETGVKRLKSSPEANGKSTPVDQQKMSDGGCPIPIQTALEGAQMEVPSKELQCIQKQVMIERLMVSEGPPSENKEELMDTQPGPSNSTGNDALEKPQGPKKSSRIPKPPPRKTFKLQSSVLARVKSFLPEMKTANIDLMRLPDPSKISLESCSDMDDTDGAGNPLPGTSASFKDNQSEDGKPFVEMNIALVDHSSSDTSSDEEDFKIVKKKIVSSPGKNSKEATKDEFESSTNASEKEKDKKNLITELN